MSEVLFYDTGANQPVNFDVNKVAEIATKSAMIEGDRVYFVSMTMIDGMEYVMAESISPFEDVANIFGATFADMVVERMDIINSG